MRALLVIALLLAPTVAAFDPPDAPLIQSIPFEGPTATAWRLFLPAHSFFSVWLAATHEEATFASFGLWFIDAETMEFNGLINPTWYDEGGHELHAQTAQTGTLVSELSGGSPWPIEMRVDFDPAYDHEWIVVALGAFEGATTGEWRMFADDGATVLATTSGDAFLLTERDLDGAANVVARESLPVRDGVVEAKAQLDAAATVPIEGALFASFWAGSHLGLQEISVDGPGDPIAMSDGFLLPGMPAGDHTFRIDRNVDENDNQPLCRALAGERCWRTPAFVLGSDIPIPQGD
ncbi:MAG TPA: hypothetical protein VM370_10740 [Candidatus Thermoplasmatota archaeon]|nr:hypothetical protein [Candidatus Thermoplasmatota archaeon]